MSIGIRNQFCGKSDVEIVSASLSDSLSAASAAGILLQNVKYLSELSVACTVDSNALPELRRMLERRGNTVRVLRRRGLSQKISAFTKRPVLILGILIAVLFTGFLPGRVLFISVEGNFTVSESRILEAAEQWGVGFGALRKDVRSEKIKNVLLDEISELEWVGINTYGCRAVISVRERKAEVTPAAESKVTSIVAARDGIVNECTVLKGNPLCRPGEAVKKGQVLISGYTDCGISILAQRADGEVFAKTRYDISAFFPAPSAIRERHRDVNGRFSLIFGKKLINLFQDSGICDSTCVRMYKEYYITLPGDFRLPIGLLYETFYISDLQMPDIAEECTHVGVEKEVERYLKSQMVAGEIISSAPDFHCTENGCFLMGSYSCSEMIGRIQSEELLKHNGEND